MMGVIKLANSGRHEERDYGAPQETCSVWEGDLAATCPERFRFKCLQMFQERGMVHT